MAAQAATLPIILVSFGRLAILSPIVNLARRPAGRTRDGGRHRRAGRRRCGDARGAVEASGRSWRRPAGSSCGSSSLSSDGAASLPFASVTLIRRSMSSRRRRGEAVLVAVTWWRRRPTVAGRIGAVALPSARARPAPIAGRAGGALEKPSATAHAAPRLLALIVAVAVAGGVVAARPAAIARVSILDVGQGDAILVEGSRGGRLLIDGGPDPDRLLVALDRRIPPWDRRIDAVILSHPHEDHVAGLALLLERYHVDRVFEPGMRGPGPGYAAWLRELAGPGRTDPARPGRRRPARRRRDRPERAVADPRAGPDRPARRRDRHQQRLGGPARPGRAAPLPVDGRRRGRHRPVAARRRACRRSTCSRSPITAAGPRRPRRSSMRSGRLSPSHRRAPETRTGILPGRRSSDSRRLVRACSGPTAMGRSSSASRRAGMTVRTRGSSHRDRV